MRYQRDEVERLIPGIWDEWRVLERKSDQAPDPEMPKGDADPRRSTDQWAALADMQRAWRLAPLSPQQRRAVTMIYGLDFTQAEAAIQLGITQSGARYAAESGVGRLLSFMNRVDLLDEEEDE